MFIKVMVVDDSKFIASEMQYMLEGTPYEVAAYCRDGGEAVAQYQRVRPDIVTMDIILPGLDGFETAKAILALDPGARFLFVSSLAYDDTVEQVRALGMEDFLFKPFDRESLLQGLDRVKAKRKGGEKG